MPYPEVFGGGRFFDKCSEEKNLITAVGSGRGRGEGGGCKHFPVGSRGKAPENFGYLEFCGAQNIVFMAVCDDKQ